MEYIWTFFAKIPLQQVKNIVDSTVLYYTWNDVFIVNTITRETDFSAPAAKGEIITDAYTQKNHGR